MRKIVSKLLLCIAALLFLQCKNDKLITATAVNKTSNQITVATGFSLQKYDGFSVLKVVNPWPNANKSYVYILKNKKCIVPDSLSSFAVINVPIKTIVVSSTTHIPSLMMLGVEKSLVGFPNLSYISSEKVRALIDSGKVAELGNNQQLNLERVIELSPTVFVGYGIDNNNPTLENLQKSGIPVILNGDWNEQTALGKAEWIKFFGALYGLEKQADNIFAKIAADYNKTITIAKKAASRPTVLAGAMFKDVWYMPKGESWGSLMFADANANYLWSKSKGTGSLNLSFETVLDRASTAEFWIQGQFSSYEEMLKANEHYSQFKAVKSKNVFTYASKKGATAGILYYELAPNRPDLVLKDLVKILHPELLPGYKPFFIEPLK